VHAAFWVNWIDSSGLIIETATYDFSEIGVGDDWTKALCVAPTLDGGVVISGDMGLAAPVLKLNEDHSWGWYANVDIGVRDHVIRAILQTRTGDIVLAGSIWDSETGHDAFLALLDEDGNEEWIQHVQLPGGEELWEIIETVEGRFLAVGEHGGASEDPFAISLEYTGEVRDIIQYDTDWVAWPLGLIQLPDSSFFSGGLGFLSEGPGIYYGQFFSAGLSRDGRVPAPPASFNLILPVDGDTILTDTIQFQWQEAIDPDPYDTVNYSLRIWSSEDTLRYDGITDPSYTLAIDSSNLYGMNSLDFSWKVAAHTILPDTSIYSETSRDFHLLISDSETASPLLPVQFSFAIHPNPFNAITTITLNVPWHEQVVEFAVVNSLGQVVKTASVQAAGGMARYANDMSGFASGVYFVSAKAGEYSAVRKIMLIK
jgi:hypothetical protein